MSDTQISGQCCCPRVSPELFSSPKRAGAEKGGEVWTHQCNLLGTSAQQWVTTYTLLVQGCLYKKNKINTKGRINHSGVFPQLRHYDAVLQPVVFISNRAVRKGFCALPFQAPHRRHPSNMQSNLLVSMSFMKLELKAVLPIHWQTILL